MSDIPSVPKRCQVEEVDFRSPVSESTFNKWGGTMNFLLDNYAIPPGSITSYAGPEANIPSGWIVCDGRAVSRTTYSNLFNAITTYWGIGNGVTTFNVPDLRGYFLRMVDATSVGQAGVDTQHASRTRVVGSAGSVEEAGSFQQDEFRQHSHTLPFAGGGSGGSIQASGDSANYNTGILAGNNGGPESRPKNAYVIFIIKT